MTNSIGSLPLGIGRPRCRLAALGAARRRAVTDRLGRSPSEAGRRRHARRAASRPCRCRSPRSSRRPCRSMLDYPARTEAIRNVTLQAKVLGLSHGAGAPPTAPTSRPATSSTASTRATSRRRSTRPRRSSSATRRSSTICKLEPRPRHRARQERLPRQGQLRPAHQRRAPGRGRARDRPGRDPHRRAQPRLHRDPRALPGRLGRNQAPVGTLVSAAGHGAQHARPARSDLCHLQARARPTSPRSRRRAPSGAVEAEVTVPGSPAAAAHQGSLTFLDNAVDRATGTITARATIANGDLGLLPGQYVRVRLHVGEQPGRADGAAGGARLEPARQICLRRRQGQSSSSSARSRSARPMASLVAVDEGRRRGRPGDRRQPAEDRPRHAGPAAAEGCRVGGLNARRGLDRSPRSVAWNPPDRSGFRRIQD